MARIKKLKFLLFLIIPLTLGLLAGCGEESGNPNLCKHKFEEWRVTSAPTCEKGGTEKRTCSICGYVEAKVTDPLGHDYEEHIKTPVTCTEDGESEFVCRNNPSHTYTEKIPAKGHDWELTGGVITPATCTEDGLGASAKCKNCSMTQDGVVLPALGHDFSGEASVLREATCMEKGEKVVYCSHGCGEKKTEEIPALGHDFSGEIVVSREATCTEKGEKSVYCTHGCGEKRTDELPALGHHADGTMKTLKDPTCTEAGKRSAHCDRCDRDYEEEIPALGHDTSGKGNLIEPATCTKGGKMVIDCPRCGLQTDGVTPALGHLFPEEYTVDVPATCFETGHEVKKCLREGCGVTLTERLTNSLGHIWDEGVVEDCECGGTLTTYHCKREGCDGIRQESSFTGLHVFGNSESVGKDSCLEGYYTQRTCSVCGYTELTHGLLLLGHQWESGYTLGRQPTQSADGYKYIVCKDCGMEKTGSRVTFPRYTMGAQMKFEVFLCRGYGRSYSGEGVVHVFDGANEVFSGKTEGQSVTFNLPAKEYTVKVTDLSAGYAAEEYLLQPSGAYLRLELKTSSVSGEKPEGKMYDIGDAFYNLPFETYDGQKCEMGELLTHYKAIILNFYYTYCPNCNTEMPALVEAAKAHPDVLIIFVNGFNESRDVVMKHAERYGISDMMIAPRFLMDDFVGGKNWGYPTTIFIDKEGTFAEMIAGGMSRETVEKLMQKYIDIAGGQDKSIPEALMPQKHEFA